MQLAAVATTPRRIAATLFVAAGIVAGTAALPTAASDGVLSSVAPSNAQAAEAGIDGDHAWMKLTKSEVLQGATAATCASVMIRFPVGYPVCPPISAAVKALADQNGGANVGIWVEIYRDGHYEYGTW
jgi:hypothetical protein